MADNIINLSAETFKDFITQATTPVLVDFWAPWCGPCKAIAPILSELATEFSGKLRIAKVNIEDEGNDALAAQFKVQAIPNMILFKNGQKIEQIAGMVPKPALQAKIQALL